jgi:hypothetical protein
MNNFWKSVILFVLSPLLIILDFFICFVGFYYVVYFVPFAYIEGEPLLFLCRMGLKAIVFGLSLSYFCLFLVKDVREVKFLYRLFKENR